jgi:outer membrane lipoprotein-sorting protein
LAEITKIDFNTLSPFRAVTHVSTGNDNTVWIYNENSQQVELFDYKANKSRIFTLPNEGEVLDLQSNFNYCWLLTSKFIYVYNYVGSLINRIPNNGYTKMDENRGDLFLLKENQLYFKLNNSSEIKPLEIPKLLINQFFVTNETLYIYNEEVLHKFQLKIN